MSFLPEADRDFLLEKQLAFQEVQDGPTNGLIFPNWVLPAAMYSVDRADLLILIPQGYSTTQLDMFYLSPAVTLKATNAPPGATTAFVFNNRTWQRWSRHFDRSPWRAGVDGIHSFLKTVESDLRKG